jgi:hypothetical protein
VGHVVADERPRPSRVDPVSGQQNDPRSGGDVFGRRSCPGNDPRAGGQCRQHGASRPRRQVVVDVKGEGWMPRPPRQRRRDRREEGVGLAVPGSVHAGEPPHSGRVRPLGQGRDDDVDPRAGERRDGHRGGAELDAPVGAPERGSGGIESDHAPSLSRGTVRDAAVPIPTPG